MSEKKKGGNYRKCKLSKNDIFPSNEKIMKGGEK
jgi:hypothetical protein